MQEAMWRITWQLVWWSGWKHCECRRGKDSWRIDGPDYSKMRQTGLSSKVQCYKGKRWAFRCGHESWECTVVLWKNTELEWWFLVAKEAESCQPPHSALAWKGDGHSPNQHCRPLVTGEGGLITEAVSPKLVPWASSIPINLPQRGKPTAVEPVPLGGLNL